MSKLINLYENILDYCSMKPDADGKVNISFVFEDGKEGETTPATLENRQLVMPIDKQFKAYDPDKVVIFHPLQEFINRGESEVVKALRYQLNVRINYATLVVASSLLELIGSPALHKNLSPEQRELLLEVPNGDMTTAARFMEFAVKRFSDASNRFFSNIYLKKAGTYQGQKHARVGVVQFPFYELIDSSDFKFKKNDDQTFKSLLNFMFPGSIDDQEAYNSFSDHRDAPWLDCLLKTSYTLAQRLNELLRLYKPYIEDAEKYIFNEDWVDELDNIEAYRAEIRRIPSQKGNEGSIETAGEPERSSLNTERVVPAPTKVEQQTYQPTPLQSGQVQVGPPIVPMQQYPGFDAYGRPIQQMPPGYGVAPVQERPGLVTTESGKLDFNSVERSNPMVAAAGMISTPLTQWHQQQMMQRPVAGGYTQQMMPGQMLPPPMIDQYGRPLQQMTDMYGRPLQQPQQMFDQYGRPVDAYGRPMQPMPGMGMNTNI